MKLSLSLFVSASLLFTFTTFTDADLEGKWPTIDKPPPPVAEWTALVDQSKIPKAPLSKAAGAGCTDKDEFCNWSCTTCTRNDTDVVKCPTKGDWGITFDDGPTEFTDALLDFLQSKNVKVTFFVIGSRVIERPETLKKAVDAGHQIGIHTWSHTALTTQSTEEIIAELKWTESAIKTAVGLTPKYMRPPFGDYDDRVRGIASQLGYKVVVWDLDTNDWMSEDFKDTFQLNWIEGNFTQWVKEPSTTGHISLEHDLYKQTAERGQLTVPIVLDAGFLIKPVAVCMGDQQPYVENYSLGNSTAPTTSSYPSAALNQPSTTPTPTVDSIVTPSSTDVAAAAQSSSPADNVTNNASTLNNNLWSIAILIVGSFIFI